MADSVTDPGVQTGRSTASSLVGEVPVRPDGREPELIEGEPFRRLPCFS